MKTLRAIIIIMLASLVDGCAAPKDSAKHFPRPKYHVETKRVRQGRASVAQTWWSHLWFWQRLSTPHPKSDD